MTADASHWDDLIVEFREDAGGVAVRCVDDFLCFNGSSRGAYSPVVFVIRFMGDALDERMRLQVDSLIDDPAKEMQDHLVRP